MCGTSLVVKNLPANPGVMGLIPGPGGSHMLWSSYACATTRETMHCTQDPTRHN